MSDVIVAPEQRDLDELSASLGRWLMDHLPDAQDLRLSNLAYPRGAGQSHETILFDANWSQDGEPRTEGMVVRIRPSSFVLYADDLFAEQYEVMRVLHETGTVPVARPLWFERDPAVLGASFFVMEKVIGRVPVSIPPYAESGWVADATPDQRRRMWKSGVQNLAAMQKVPLDKLTFLQGPPHARDGLEQEFEKYARLAALVGQDRPWPILETGMARLRDLWPESQPAGLVWGDARIGNMMFGDDFQVVAVVDWEQPSLGGALNDLAWWVVNGEIMHGANATRPHLPGFGTREETIALWQDITGISAEGIEWYEDFTRFKMTCLGIRMAALRGAPPPDEGVLAERLKVG